MTLIENLVGKGLSVEDYEFQARRLFCQPSEKTLAFAETVLDRLEGKLEEEMELYFYESGGYEECVAGLEVWDD